MIGFYKKRIAIGNYFIIDELVGDINQITNLEFVLNMIRTSNRLVFELFYDWCQPKQQRPHD